MAGLECDALALIVVRLDSAVPNEGDLCWHSWNEASGATPHGISARASSNPRSHEPFKRYPNGDAPYFSPHVTRVLFPTNGYRRVCCPDDLYLDVTHTHRPTRRARIDLIERLTTPVDMGGTLGLIHLSLCPAEEDDSDGTLSWASAIRTTYLKRTNPLDFYLRGQDRETALGERPLARLVERLFGDPHPHLDRHFYTALMAPYPDERRFAEAALQAEWRHALAIRSYELGEDRRDPYELEREESQTIHIADADALVLRNCSVLATRNPIGGMAATNFRSYWTESLVFGLLQQSYIEQFQGRLAEIGALPHKETEKRLGRLHDSWLSFRNLLWWSQPSSSADPPRELLKLLREAQGTDLLFRDLEEDMATYSSLQHRDLEDRQARALTNLQVYGAAAAVLSTMATVGALFEFSDSGAARFVAVALVVSIVAGLIVRLFVRRN